MRRFANDDGGLDAVFTLVAVFLFAGFLFLAFGFGIDQITKLLNIGAFASATASQARYDIVDMQIQAFRVSPFVIFLGLVVYSFTAANRETSAVSQMASLTEGAIEAGFVQVAMIAITAFGGLGIDTTVRAANGLIAGAGNTGLYDMVQFIPGLFYGLCLLISIGVIILFTLRCAQIIDFSASQVI